MTRSDRRAAPGARSATAVPMFVVVLLVSAINLRTPITSISSALTEVTDAYRLSETAASVLVTLPVVVFAVAAPVGPWLGNRLGVDRAIVLLQAVLALSMLLRPLNAWLLMLGTTTSAVAISAISILASAVFRRGDQRQAANLTSVFTGVLSAGASIGALFSLPLIELAGGSVPLALAGWALPAAAAAVALGVLLRDEHPPDPVLVDPRPTLSYLRLPAAWALAAYFGLQSLVFYGATAWLPTLLRDRGVDPQGAAVTYVVVSMIGLLGSLSAPRLAVDPRRRPSVVTAFAALGVAGMLGLAFAPLAQRFVWATALGLSLGAAFALSLSFVVFRARSTAEAASLSAVTQGVGYAIAALGPLLMGLVHTATGSWVAPALGLVAASALAGVFGVRAGRDAPVTSVR